MKIKRSQIAQIVREEMSRGHYLSEELTPQDFDVLRKFIRREIALVMFDLFKRRNTWI